jgi:hypothetical protein
MEAIGSILQMPEKTVEPDRSFMETPYIQKQSKSTNATVDSTAPYPLPLRAISDHQMARARRRRPRLPRCHLTSHLKLDRTTSEHQLIMRNPILVPLLPIDPHALHEVTAFFIVESIGHDTEGIVAVDRDVDIVEPRRADEEYWLGNNRVEAQLLPDEPRIECAGIGIAG